MIIEASDLSLITKFIAGLDQLSADTGVYIDVYDGDSVSISQDGEIVGTLHNYPGTGRYGFAQ